MHFPVSQTIAIVMTNKTESDFEGLAYLTIPVEEVQGSMSLELNLLNPLEKTLGSMYDSLIHEPHGCFEQVR